jgi:hypothetical protein
MSKIQQLYNVKTQLLAVKDYDVKELVDIINKKIKEAKDNDND